MLEFFPSGKPSTPLTMKTLKLALMISALLAGGCANDLQHDRHAAATGAEFLPKPPVFMTAPVGTLLTHPDGFAARVVMTSAPADQVRPVTGQLLARGSKFFFLPDPLSGRQARAGQFSFIWDAALNRGYILSEAMQGCAPITAISLTNLAVQESPGVTETLSGYHVAKSLAVVTAVDGHPAQLEVARAQELGGLPIRIRSLDADAPWTVSLSAIQPGHSADNLFLPPDGFTVFESEVAMMKELAGRQQSSRPHEDTFNQEGGNPGGGRNRRSRGGSEPGP